MLITFIGSASWTKDFSEYNEANINWQQCKGESIRVLLGTEPASEAINSLAPEFEKLTGIKTEVLVLRGEDAIQKTTVDCVAGTGHYDVFMITNRDVVQFVTAGWLEALDPYVNDPKLTNKKWFDAEDIVPKYCQTLNIDGHQYGFPHYVESSFWYYRKDLFEQAGLEPPTTLAGIWGTAATLNKPGKIAGVVLVGMRGKYQCGSRWNGFLKGFGGSYFADFPNDFHVVANNPIGIAATDYYAELDKKYGPKGVAGWDWAEEITAAQEGKVAMFYETTDFGPLLSDPSKSKTAGKWGTFVGPKEIWPSCDSHGVTINYASKHKKAAWLFIEWAISKPTARKIAMEVLIPNRDSLFMDSELIAKAKKVCNGEWYPTMRKTFALASPDFYDVFPLLGETTDRLSAAVQSVIAGETTAKEALDAAVKAIEAKLKKEGYIK